MNTQRHTFPFLGVAFVGLALLGALVMLSQWHSTSAQSGAPQALDISVGDYWFCDPSFREAVCDTAIQPGDTVVWDFAQAGSAHSVVECGASCDHPTAEPAWNSGLINDGSTYRHTFSEPGVYLYYCDVHPTQMRGRVIVGETTVTPGQQSTPTPPGTTPAPASDLYKLAANLEIERFASGLQLPVNIAFAPRPTSISNGAFLYVSELYRGVAAVTKNGSVSTYAGGLLNFDPTAEFPGSGENGVVGVAVEPGTGDVFAGLAHAQGQDIASRVLRLSRSADGLTSVGKSVVLDGIPAAPSHQMQSLSFGPDGMLYVNVGDAAQYAAAQDPSSPLGKILRVDPTDGSRPPDNPIPGSLAYAIGFRNPFGAAWSPNGELYVTDNGPDGLPDRVVRADAGGNYGWCCDFRENTLYLFLEERIVSVTALAFDTQHILSPANETHVFVAAAGPTYARAEVRTGKVILDLTLNDLGRVGDVREVLRYVGDGYSTVLGLAFGPDGLYFTDLYGETGFEAGPPNGSIYRVFAQTRPTATPTPTPTATVATSQTPVPTPIPQLLGDVDCNGRRDSTDAALVLQFDAGLLVALPCRAGDLNHDGATNSLDAALLLQLAAGLIAGPL